MFDCKDDRQNVSVLLNIEESPLMFFKIIGDFVREGFAKNYGGYPRSDVALLNEQNDLNALQKILNRLDQRVTDGVSEEVSDTDLSIMHKSKYCQTASEMIKYYENLLEIRDKRIEEALNVEDRKKLDAEVKAKKDALRATLTAEEKEYLRKKSRESEIEGLLNNS